MKKLEDHNRERQEQHQRLNNNSPRLNGIECPECGSELFDSTPLFTLTSNPPQKNIHCSSCKYKGYRVA